MIPRLPTARCVQLRTRATTHSPSRIVTGQPWAPGRRGGLLLQALRLGQWQETQARAAGQIHHNLNWDLMGYGAGFSIGPKGGPVLLEVTSEGHMRNLLTPAENHPQDRPVGKEREGLSPWCPGAPNLCFLPFPRFPCPGLCRTQEVWTLLDTAAHPLPGSPEEEISSSCLQVSCILILGPATLVTGIQWLPKLNLCHPW